jgi:hypothetical protein
MDAAHFGPARRLIAGRGAAQVRPVAGLAGRQRAVRRQGLPSGSLSTTVEKKTLPAAHREPRETAAAALVTLSVRLVATSGAAGSPGGIPGGGANQGTDEAEKPKRAVSDYVVVGTHAVGLLGGHCIDRLQDALRCAKPLLNCRARTRSRLPNSCTGHGH